MVANERDLKLERQINTRSLGEVVGVPNPQSNITVGFRDIIIVGFFIIWITNSKIF